MRKKICFTVCGAAALLAFALVWFFLQKNAGYYDLMPSGVFVRLAPYFDLCVQILFGAGVVYAFAAKRRGVPARLHENRALRLGLFWGIFLVGTAMRFFGVGSMVKALYTDEGCALYNGWCLYAYGTDFQGFPYPVYFEAWGGGQSALLSYLTALCIALFGNTVWAVRLPPAFFSSLCIPAAYGIGKKLGGRWGALLGELFCAFCPYFFLIGRWSWDCNLFPMLLLPAILFLLKAVEENPWWWVACGGTLGLSLYAYAVGWPFVVLAGAGIAIYLAVCRKIKLVPFLVGMGVLFAFALPLICFLMVNWGWIEPFRFLGVFSVCRLSGFRGGEFVFDWARLVGFLQVAFFQVDVLFENGIHPFGAFFSIGGVLALLGLFFCVRETAKTIKRRMYTPKALLVVFALVSLAEGCFVASLMHHDNFFWAPCLCLATVGGTEVCKRNFASALVLLGCFAALALAFYAYYYHNGISILSGLHREGLMEAVAFAETIRLPDQVVQIEASHANYYFCALWKLGISPQEYMETIQYGEPDHWLRTMRCVAHLQGYIDPSAENGIFLLYWQNAQTFLPPEGYTAQAFGQFILYFPAALL